MSRSDRVSIRPSCFGNYTRDMRPDRGCHTCKSSIDCIPPQDETTMAGDAKWMEIPYHGDPGKETLRGADAIQVGGDHYRSKAVQPWDAMAAWMTPDEFAGFLRGNVIKYVARCNDKGGIEDLLKARHYLDKLIEVRK